MWCFFFRPNIGGGLKNKNIRQNNQNKRLLKLFRVEYNNVDGRRGIF